MRAMNPRAERRHVCFFFLSSSLRLRAKIPQRDRNISPRGDQEMHFCLLCQFSQTGRRINTQTEAHSSAITLKRENSVRLRSVHSIFPVHWIRWLSEYSNRKLLQQVSKENTNKCPLDAHIFHIRKFQPSPPAKWNTHRMIDLALVYIV